MVAPCRPLLAPASRRPRPNRVRGTVEGRPELPAGLGLVRVRVRVRLRVRVRVRVRMRVRMRMRVRVRVATKQNIG